MKRYFLGLGLATVMALVYVQQRVSVITLGYEVERLSSLRDDLLDQHRVLDYNVLTLRSPVILEERLSRKNVQLIPPTAVEVLSPRSGMVSSAPAWEGWVKSEPSWLDRVLTFATQWAEQDHQAIAAPAKEEQ